MPTFQFLPSIHDSETITCRRCNTRQYLKNGNCIRCHRPLGVDYVYFQIGASLGQRSEDQPKQPQVVTVGIEPSVNARNAKRQLDTLRSQLATAQADLEDANYNLSIVTTHQRTSREGKIDANWWDAAMRFWMLDTDEEPVYRLGSYPVKVMRWIRHLVFTLNAEHRDVLSAIADLEPKVAALSQIIGDAIT